MKQRKNISLTVLIIIGLIIGIAIKRIGVGLLIGVVLGFLATAFISSKKEEED